ncbi:hypothetical protein MAP00_007440 [Monascus purpureus]|nr:hypothetical protein MAP00_007440 [Monascus purpureus]
MANPEPASQRIPTGIALPPTRLRIPEFTPLILRLSVTEWLEDVMPESGVVEMAKRIAGGSEGDNGTGEALTDVVLIGHQFLREPGMGAACCGCTGRQSAVADLVSTGGISGWREH